MGLKIPSWFDDVVDYVGRINAIACDPKLEKLKKYSNSSP
jgi:hypothetical protein